MIFPAGQSALLIINGEEPKVLPDRDAYELLACTDGALNYLEKNNINPEQVSFISGDFDSVLPELKNKYASKCIATPDQDFTDFYKALDIIKTNYPEIKYVHVVGCGGKEMDHFLGNLTVAFAFRNDFHILLEDNFSHYFFVEKESEIYNQKNKILSLYPFTTTKNITSTGLRWSLTKGSLDITGQIGTRNIVDENVVHITYEEGALLVFISKNTSEIRSLNKDNSQNLPNENPI